LRPQSLFAVSVGQAKSDNNGTERALIHRVREKRHHPAVPITARLALCAFVAVWVSGASAAPAPKDSERPG
jgi:hypothetical protein